MTDVKYDLYLCKRNLSMDEKTIKEALRKGERVMPFVNGQRWRCRSRVADNVINNFGKAKVTKKVSLGDLFGFR